MRRFLRPARAAAVFFVAACTSFRPTTLQRVDPDDRVILSSGRPFLFHAQVRRETTACASHEVAGRLVRQIGDTVHLAVTARRPLNADEPAACAVPASGFVVMSPTINVQGSQLAVLRTSGLVFAGLMVAAYLAEAIPTWTLY